MWNKIAGNSAPPQGRAPVMAQNDEEDQQEVASGAPNDEADEADGQGMQDMQDQGDMQEPGGDQPGGNVVGETLRDRAKMLTPQESQAFFDGITVPALMVLKKILPEISPAIDQAIAKKGGQGGAPGAAPGGMPPPAPGGMPPPAGMPPQAAARPAPSKLFSV